LLEKHKNTNIEELLLELKEDMEKQMLTSLEVRLLSPKFKKQKDEIKKEIYKMVKGFIEKQEEYLYTYLNKFKKENNRLPSKRELSKELDIQIKK